jgi:hypothetical protein
MLQGKPNIAENFLPKKSEILGTFGDIGTFGDMGAEIKFLNQNEKCVGVRNDVII